MALTGISHHLPSPPPRESRNSDATAPNNFPLLWRLATIALIPLSVWLVTAALYDRIPQSAGTLHYDVVVNKLTGSACIEVKNEPLPKSLTELGC